MSPALLSKSFAPFSLDPTEQDSFSKLPKPKDDAEMDITPMIDITFLLLIFFLVASKMDSDSEIELPTAKNGTAVTTKNSAIVTITDAGDGQVNIYLGNGAVAANRITTNDLAEQETLIADYIDRLLRQENKAQVIIKAAKDIKHRDVARIMQAVGMVDNAKLYVAVLEES